MQWRAPSPNPPKANPLPSGIARTYIKTPSGPLELLSVTPSSPNPSAPPLFFAHGGFGCAEIWIDYMQLFASKGYPCYAMSYRGHGKSWYPGFWRMYFTSRGFVAGDLVAGIEHVESLERDRRQEDDVKVVLIAHSAGGALSQYVLSRGLAKVYGFCMLAAVPGFGSYVSPVMPNHLFNTLVAQRTNKISSFGCYKFWSLTAPIHFPYRLFHSKYILANTQQVKDAFFTSDTPTKVVQHLERLLAPYESMLWPLQSLFRFVTGPDVLSSIIGWRPRKLTTTSTKLQPGGAGVTQRLLVLAAEHDVLCTPAISLDAAQRYRAGFHELMRKGKLEGIRRSDESSEQEQGSEWDGVAFKLVPGLGHHLQNHVGWESGAQELLTWIEQL